MGRKVVRVGRIHKLTAAKVAALRTKGLYNDGGCLCFRIARGGSRGWVFRYTRNGRRHDMGLGADSDDPGQGFQLKAATIPIEGGQYCPVGTFMGSQRW
jgi:hypothetical protein